MCLKALPPESGALASDAGVPGIAELREDLRRAFEPHRSLAPEPRRIGIEVEWICLLTRDGRPAPVEAPAGGPSLLTMLRGAGERAGWTQRGTTNEAEGAFVVFETPEGGRISLEPGGQVEYSSSPREGTGPLLLELEAVTCFLSDEAERAGIRLVSRGIDPLNPVERAPLRVSTPRYRRMARHLEGFGPAGRRMMRQTAALHVNLDFGDDPLLQWRVANALSPYVISIFANSSRHAGAATGFRSFRARQWRELDPDGRAIPASASAAGLDEAVEEYLTFALESPSILQGGADDTPLPFSHWVGRAGMRDWHHHLSTIFPEVRPRGYLEIRSCDTLPSRWQMVPVVFLAGLLYDPDALRAAERRLPSPSSRELNDAARSGLADPVRRRLAMELVELAVEGAGRLGTDVVDRESLDRAETFFRRFTARGVDPASDGSIVLPRGPSG